jgi:hypothetical protein
VCPARVITWRYNWDHLRVAEKDFRVIAGELNYAMAITEGDVNPFCS